MKASAKFPDWCVECETLAESYEEDLPTFSSTLANSKRRQREVQEARRIGRTNGAFQEHPLPDVAVTDRTCLGYCVKRSFNIWSDAEFLAEFGVSLRDCGLSLNATVVNEAGAEEHVFIARSPRCRQLVTYSTLVNKLEWGRLQKHVRPGQAEVAFDKAVGREIAASSFMGEGQSKLLSSIDIEKKAVVVRGERENKEQAQEQGASEESSSDEPDAGEPDGRRRGRLSGRQLVKKKQKKTSTGTAESKGRIRRPRSAPVAALRELGSFSGVSVAPSPNKVQALTSSLNLGKLGSSVSIGGLTAVQPSAAPGDSGASTGAGNTSLLNSAFNFTGVLAGTVDRTALNGVWPSVVRQRFACELAWFWVWALGCPLAFRTPAPASPSRLSRPGRTKSAGTESDLPQQALAKGTVLQVSLVYWHRGSGRAGLPNRNKAGGRIRVAQGSGSRARPGLLPCPPSPAGVAAHESGCCPGLGGSVGSFSVDWFTEPTVNLSVGKFTRRGARPPPTGGQLALPEGPAPPVAEGSPRARSALRVLPSTGGWEHRAG